MEYLFQVADRSYTQWWLLDSKGGKVNAEIDPLSSKLLHGDLISIGTDKSVTILSSPVRLKTSIPAVLVLAGNKTYGPSTNKQNAKQLYKCIPNDTRLPCCLVPHQLKNVGFTKVFANQYITIRFLEWTGTMKHPVGRVESVIGSVNEEVAFFEYELVCKDLQCSISPFHKATLRAMESLLYKTCFAEGQLEQGMVELLGEKYVDIEDRTHQNVITIDSSTTTDFDDAFTFDSGDKETALLSIYIANVPLWIDFLSLWDSFTDRVATIYLPDKKRPMLPVMLSENLCSLQQGVKRVAFAMDVSLNKDTGEILNIAFKNVFIRVYKNHHYESKELQSDSLYVDLFAFLSSILVRRYPYLSEIKDSHELVAYIMLLMNHQCAVRMKDSFGIGIFRKHRVLSTGKAAKVCPPEVADIYKIWGTMASSEYVSLSCRDSICHDALQLDAYVHITSPIRRLVDVLNMFQLQQALGLGTFSERADCFCKEWTSQLPFLNDSSKKIRRVQSNCELLHLCLSEEALEKVYNGYVLEEEVLTEKVRYTVYLMELKRVVEVTDVSVWDSVYGKFKLYLFTSEDKLKFKVRVQRIV